MTYYVVIKTNAAGQMTRIWITPIKPAAADLLEIIECENSRQARCILADRTLAAREVTTDE